MVEHLLVPGSSAGKAYVHMVAWQQQAAVACSLAPPLTCSSRRRSRCAPGCTITTTAAATGVRVWHGKRRVLQGGRQRGRRPCERRSQQGSSGGARGGGV